MKVTENIPGAHIMVRALILGWGQNMDQGSMDPLFGPGPLSWTESMGPLSWTRSMDSFFFYFYKKVLHQVHGHSKTEIVPKKDLTRRCQPMLTIDHKYLVVLTWRILCLHMCSCKTVKLNQYSKVITKRGITRSSTKTRITLRKTSWS